MSKFIGQPAMGIPLTMGIPLMAVALSAVGLTIGLTSASANLGEYTTRVPESRLFVNGGRILRCDLFFSAPGISPAVAPKGSELMQSVPPVVWQYSGLLPVSDYLKTVAIHSVASDEKIRPWQEVQSLFYSGLRAEGAYDADAKIAYAGAYAFAPRWPLVELKEVVEEEIIYPDTVLYEVQYTAPKMKGLSLEDYRALALQILDQPDAVTLDDIRSVVDSADAANVKVRERASLGGIGNTNTGSFEGIKGGLKGIKTNNDGTVRLSNEGILANSGDASTTEARKVASVDTEMLGKESGVEVSIPEALTADQETAVKETLAESSVSDIETMVGKEIFSLDEELSEVVEKPQDTMVKDTSDVMQLEGPQDEWIMLPDGSMVLRSIERLLSQ